MSLVSRFFNKSANRPAGDVRPPDQGMLFRVESHDLPCTVHDVGIELRYMTVGFCTASPITSSGLALPQSIRVRLAHGEHTFVMDGMEHAVGTGDGPDGPASPGNNPPGCGDSN